MDNIYHYTSLFYYIHTEIYSQFPYKKTRLKNSDGQLQQPKWLSHICIKRLVQSGETSQNTEPI